MPRRTELASEIFAQVTFLLFHPAVKYLQPRTHHAETLLDWSLPFYRFYWLQRKRGSQKHLQRRRTTTARIRGRTLADLSPSHEGNHRFQPVQKDQYPKNLLPLVPHQYVP